MKRLLCMSAMALSSILPARARAVNFAELGQELTPDQDAEVDVTGALRVRGESLFNLDLDRGLTPAGRPLYPVPLADERDQMLTHSDMRLRTDTSLYAPFGSMRVNVRLDVLDNLTLGSNANATPVTTTTQLAPSERAFRIKRAYGEALTPFGVLIAGRAPNVWGLGMLANSGDCPDCDNGDVSDRVAFVTSQLDHFVALAYDINFVGPTAPRVFDTREVDLESTDNVRGITAAILRFRDETALIRRRKAGLLTLDYGLSYAYRWQRNDIPAAYVPTEEPVPIDANQVVSRRFSASLADAWVRLIGPSFRVEAEAAVLAATIGEGTLVPGVRFGQPLTSVQSGGVIQSDFGAPESAFSAGLDLGYASGDDAPGFGANPGPNDLPGMPGDLDGPQANPPVDNTVNNLRFNPDYRVDQILFREIIGTVTDAAYIRPHMRWDVWKAAPGKLTFKASMLASFALFSTSTPGGDTPLGVEIDPSLVYTSRDKFSMGLDYGILFPLSGLGNAVEGLPARPAQLVRARVIYGF